MHNIQTGNYNLFLFNLNEFLQDDIFMTLEKRLLSFVYLSERLKMELRHSWLSDGREESVAEHVWRVSLMVILFHPYLDQKIDVEKALKMSVIHDLAEVITGDIPYYLTPEGSEAKLQKEVDEKKAMESIREELKCIVGEEIEALWIEYEINETYEAKFVRALDKIEAQMQRNQAPLETWNEHELRDLPKRLDSFCKFDIFLEKIKGTVQDQCLEKLNRDKESGTKIKGRS